ncbi:LacI family DNA-binding transcriptional regulator [Nocardioides sp. WG-D5]
MASGESRHSVSVKDVAGAAGVSLGTVSNVLNRPTLVSAKTRALVEAAMRDLGFVRNESARQLRAGSSRTLGYVMLDAGNPFFADVAQGMEEAAEAADLALLLCNSGQRPARENVHLEFLEQQRVQGILITPVNPDAPGLLEIQLRGTPLVVVDRTRSDSSLCSVAVDDFRGGALAIEHLLERGHDRIAFVGGPMSLGQVQDRLAGARAAWADAGRPSSALSVISSDKMDVGSGRLAVGCMGRLPRAERPTAAFCANDLVALGLLQSAIGHGINVPTDLAIVGYDDIQFASAAAVPLTSVRQPNVEIGRAAAELALDESRNPDHVHAQIKFTPELIVRDSTQ